MMDHAKNATLNDAGVFLFGIAIPCVGANGAATAQPGSTNLDKKCD